MKKCLLLCALALTSLAGYSQEIIDIWRDRTPRSVAPTPREEERTDNNGIIFNVARAELHVYPAQGSGKAVLVIPGGGYSVVSMHYEGVEIAKWLNANGITAAVLKYRLPAGVAEAPMEDAAEALAFLRANGERWGGYSPDSIGIMGFSAGGHLAAMTSVREKLAFSVLFYPVITQTSHPGSFTALFGRRRNNYVDTYTPTLQVTKNTPPAIIIHAADDTVVDIKGAEAYRQALCYNGVYNVFVTLPSGGHGFGLKPDMPYSELVKAQIMTFLNTLPGK